MCSGEKLCTYARTDPPSSRLLKDSGLPEGKTLATLEEGRLSAATRRTVGRTL